MSEVSKVVEIFSVKLKDKVVTLADTVSLSEFCRVFFDELFKLSNELVKLGIKEFYLRRTNGMSLAQSFNLATILLYRSFREKDFDANSFLSGLADRRSGNFELYYVLSSIISDSRDLGGGVSIKPLSSTVNEAGDFVEKDLNEFIWGISPEFGIVQDELAVLRIQVPVNDMVIDKVDGISNEYKTDDLPGYFADKKLLEIQEILSLFSNKKVAVLGGWCSHSDRRLDWISRYKFYKNPDYYSEGGGIFFGSFKSQTDWERAIELLPMLTLSRGAEVVDVSLKRIYQSMQNKDLMGKVIDLSIALEVMCVEGSGDNSYKVSTHVAWAISDASDVRERVMREVKDFYALRSSIVHAGEVKEEKYKKYGGVIGLYDLILGYAKQVLIQIAHLGKKPDWRRVAANGGQLQLQ